MFYNVSAVTAQLVDLARTMDTRESYEQTYNTGDWTAAKEALTSAKMTAREDELGIIKVQRSNVTQHQGRDKEVQTIYNLSFRGQQQPNRCQPGPEQEEEDQGSHCGESGDKA